MKVQILTHTPNPEKVIAQSAKLCYSPVGVEELSENLTEESINKFVNNLAKIGHLSPFEHATFTFAIEGVDRTLTHQLVRHRIASFSQQSQRYVKLSDSFEHTTPNVVREMGEEFVHEWHGDIMGMLELYNKWEEKIEQFVIVNDYPTNGMNAEKVACENARGMLPNACETKIVVTMNVRSLYHFFEKRCCNRAQEPIRELADEMLRLCREVSPVLFNNAGAPCVRGKCVEGKMTCGKPKNKEEK